MAEKFKKGDTVELKSGGPIMTVRDTGEGYVVCCYFDQEMKLQGDYTFHEDMLKSVKLE